jgi:hypothetical protein
VFLGRGTGPLPSARVLAVLALPFALIQSAAEVHIGGSNLGDPIAAFDLFFLLAAAEHRSGGQAAQSSSRELVKIAPIKRFVSHEIVVLD